MSVRSLIERASRGVVLRRRLPPEFGRGLLYVSPEGGGLRFWRFDTRKMDPFLFRSVERMVRQGDAVWDIGANMGLFAFAAAYRAGGSGSVLALEPDVDAVALLLRSRASHTAGTGAKVDVVAGAVRAGPAGFAAFEISPRARSSNSLSGAGLSQKGGVRETRLVPAWSLDELLGHFAPPNVVKIDIEGAEASALEGAPRLLQEVRPVLIVEVERESAAEVGKILARFDYRFFDGDAPGEEWVERSSPTWNCHAIPNEKVATYVAA